MKHEGIHNEMILASAGSGKTYQLTGRFIRLMALGAEPERIIALTFTRKAAGEFFAEIVKKLSRAAGDGGDARRLAREIGCPDVSREGFLDLLELLMSRMHLLELGTLDSFFYRVVRNFPFELGLAGPPELLDENEADVEKHRVYAHVFRRPETRGEGRREFLEAFKQSTWGSEEKRLVATLDRFIEEHHDVFLAAPREDLWGDPERIWPEGNTWLGARVDPEREIEILDRRFGDAAASGLTEGQRTAWEKFLDAMREWRPGAPWSGGMKTPVKNALKVWDDLCAGAAEFTIGRKKLRLGAEECGALANLVRYLFASEIEKKLQVTRGLYQILRAYERDYAALVRSGGRLTFRDIPILLSGPSEGEATPRLVGEAGGEGKLAIDYRLDARYDHWLLDEFQDTSYTQWRILRDLIDEVVQDPEGRRSFFYVGDVKQAIFAWREGDARLFREIFDHYNAASPNGIVERRMSESWRSGPAIIETVNRVFGDESVIGELFPSPATERWREGWDPHEARHTDRKGCVAYYEVKNTEERYALVLELLQRIEPWRRGLSCALLVQRNRVAGELLEYIRTNSDIPVASETDVRPGIDNPLGAALLSLFKWAGYPGDTYAREHVGMTPLRELAEKRFDGGLGELRREVLAAIYREGFAATAEAWIDRLDGSGGLDAFNRGRAERIVAAARSFDRSGNRSIADFVDFLSRYSLREAGSADTVQVLTIHKSKGLGFDMTILPDLEGNSLDVRRSGLGVSRTADRDVEWVLDLPAREIVENDEVLSRYNGAEEAEACYEKFCQLYVAMTRARHAMYLVAEERGKSATSRNYVKWLNETLGNGGGPSPRTAGAANGVVYERGDPEWFEAAGVEPDRGEKAGRPERAIRSFPARAKYRRRIPSQETLARVSARRLFSMDSKRSLEYGTRVHELFADVGWIDEESSETPEASSALGDESSVSAAARGEVLACLNEPVVRSALTKPAAGAELWREKSFEVLLDGEWMTGVFDRVVLEKDAAGRITRATVLDYKTDKIDPGEPIDPEAMGYASQIRTYRRALAFMTGLSEETISCRLLFTKRRELVEV